MRFSRIVTISHRIETPLMSEKLTGILAHTMPDPLMADRELLLASFAWNHEAAGAPDHNARACAIMRHGELAEQFLAADQALQEAGDALPKILLSSGCDTETCDGPAAIAAALAALQESGAEAAADVLARVVKTARKAQNGFTAVLKALPENASTTDGVNSWIAECAGLEALASVYRALLMDPKAKAKAKTPLVVAMKVIEERKPAFAATAMLRCLSVLLKYIEDTAN